MKQFLYYKTVCIWEWNHNPISMKKDKSMKIGILKMYTKYFCSFTPHDLWEEMMYEETMSCDERNSNEVYSVKIYTSRLLFYYKTQ